MTPEGGILWGQSWLDAGVVSVQLWHLLRKDLLRFKQPHRSAQAFHVNLKNEAAILSDSGQRCFSVSRSFFAKHWRGLLPEEVRAFSMRNVGGRPLHGRTAKTFPSIYAGKTRIH